MRPAVFQVGGTLYWTMLTRNPDTLVLKDADSTPSVAVTRNGTPSGDSVTVTKRSATTGIYDCSYNPAGETEGESFHFLETATVTGTTTSAQSYPFGWAARCVAVERGTNNASTFDPTTQAVELDSATLQKIDDIREDTGTTLPGLIAGIEGGSGGLTGPYTRTITVTDADTDEPIEGAKVRLYRTGETGTVATDDDGIASFTVEAATWSYGVTASGYTGVSGSVVVGANGNTDVQIEASAATSPTAPDGCVIQVLCLNGVTAQQGVVIQYRAASIPTGDTNRAFLGTTQTATSNSSGIATFEVAQGSGFEWKRGDVVEWSAETAPQAETMNVRSIIGAAR